MKADSEEEVEDESDETDSDFTDFPSNCTSDSKIDFIADE